MNRAMFDGKLSVDEKEKLYAIEDDVDALVARKVGRFAVWQSSEDGTVRRLRASDSSILFEVNASEFSVKVALDALGAVAANCEREFVIGYYDAESGVSEDIAFMKDASEVDSTFEEVCSFLDL